MNALEKRNALDSNRQAPSCLGKMVNIFEQNNEAVGSRMIADKPHNDGYHVGRSRSDTGRLPSSNFGVDKMISFKAKRNIPNKQDNGTPMKTLIAQELSREEETKQSSPNLVAKLMGLDAFPNPKSTVKMQRNVSSMKYETNGCRNEAEFKDVYEIRQPSDVKHVREIASTKGLFTGKTSEQRMSLVREKFIEAKRLATDEKGCQSKEFIDAVEVLSSNRDLFLKFLQESNSMFTNHLYDMQSTISTPDTKRITVLKPSNSVDSDKKNEAHSGHDATWKRSAPVCSEAKLDDYLSQPTRIVVLKPTPGRAQDLMIPNAVSDSADHQGDEALVSSVFSNGEVGDESSCAQSNVSDSEILSPVSKHSWDYINKFGSPYSNSSFSRASCSPESSVCREAKKRLSERWAIMASNSIPEDDKDCRKNSSTLGEMLSILDTKAPEIQEASEDEQEMKASTSCFLSNVDLCKAPHVLLRSKSLPASDTAFESRTKLQSMTAELMNQGEKNMKSSFKGRVASLLLSKIKRSKGKSALLQLQCDSLIPFSEPIPLPSSLDKAPDNGSFSYCSLEDCLSPGRNGFSSRPARNEADIAHENAIENLNQSNSISDLEPFSDDENTFPEPSARITSDRGAGISLRSNLIGKSPPIGSISRTVSWNDSFMETCSLNSKASSPSSRSDVEEPDWMFLLETLLSEAGLLTELQSQSLFAKFHSSESPLDPSIREKYANLDNKELLQEAKRRRMRSYRKLVFDFVNSSLVELASNGFLHVIEPHQDLDSCSSPPPPLLVNYLWAAMKEWFVSKVKWTSGDPSDSSLIVDSALRKEVVGKGWIDGLNTELSRIQKDIEDTLLNQLVEETILE